MSEFSSSEIEAALAHFRRLRSAGPSTSRPASAHLSQTIQSLEARLTKNHASMKNAQMKPEILATNTSARRS